MTTATPLRAKWTKPKLLALDGRPTSGQGLANVQIGFGFYGDITGGSDSINLTNVTPGTGTGS